jgi:hypothetical protein
MHRTARDEAEPRHLTKVNKDWGFSQLLQCTDESKHVPHPCHRANEGERGQSPWYKAKISYKVLYRGRRSL